MQRKMRSALFSPPDLLIPNHSPLESGFLLRLILRRLRCKLARVVVACRSLEGYVDAVEAVDGQNRKGKVDQFLLGKLAVGQLINIIGHIFIRKFGNSLCPGKRGTFPLRVKWRFAPCIEHINALFCFAAGAQVLRMHIQAKGAAVDLRYPVLY